MHLVACCSCSLQSFWFWIHFWTCVVDLTLLVEVLLVHYKNVTKCLSSMAEKVIVPVLRQLC